MDQHWTPPLSLEEILCGDNDDNPTMVFPDEYLSISNATQQFNKNVNNEMLDEADLASSEAIQAPNGSGNKNSEIRDLLRQTNGILPTSDTVCFAQDSSKASVPADEKLPLYMDAKFFKLKPKQNSEFNARIERLANRANVVNSELEMLFPTLFGSEANQDLSDLTRNTQKQMFRYELSSVGDVRGTPIHEPVAKKQIKEEQLYSRLVSSDEIDENVSEDLPESNNNLNYSELFRDDQSIEIPPNVPCKKYYNARQIYLLKRQH